MLDIPITPFENWDVNRAKQSLGWWQAYDEVKHGRQANLRQANLKNVLHALAALFVLETYFLKEVADNESARDIPNDNSNLFVLLDWQTNYITMGNLGFRIMTEKK